MLTDKAYQGRFVQQVQALGWQHHVASRPPTATCGFVPVAKRWVVERTFAWLNCFRRVSWTMNASLLAMRRGFSLPT